MGILTVWTHAGSHGWVMRPNIRLPDTEFAGEQDEATALRVR
jgi:hypothetical protein